MSAVTARAVSSKPSIPPVARARTWAPSRIVTRLDASSCASARDSLHDAAAVAIGSWISELAGRFAVAGLAQAEAHELASSLVTILEGAHVLARATGGIGRFDETARAVIALVECRYGR